MKTIIFIRHAKSSWDDPAMSDFDRPLNDRGKRDAPEMAERLVKKRIKVDAFISSPARRARKTAVVFAKTYGLSKEDVILKDELYHPSETAFFDVITQITDPLETIAIFSHNPGITDFVNLLSNVRIDNVPTCGMFAVSFNGDWASFRQANKNFLFFDYPKNGSHD
ncbi:MAG TPA: histidine phosphatase family protein [Chitinophagaceae bacterium]|nr:histidine phosphatase family protein [Chitinophagaceae bacterium]